MRALGITAALVAFALPHAASARGLSAAEKALMQSKIRAFWRAAQNAVKVTLRFTLDRQARPDAGSVRMVAGDADENAPAFKAAKRAVLRCGRAGYTLPVEKYEQWRDIELTFDPERTVLR